MNKQTRSESAERVSSVNRKTVHRTVFTAAYAAAALSSPARSIKKPDTRTGIWFLGTPEGTRNTMVPASSSRRRANVHRTFAFYGSSPRYKNNPNPSPTEIRFGLFCFGTPEGTRTPNPRNRNPMLYPLSHRRIFQSQIIIAGFAGFVKRKTKFFSEHMVEYGGKRLFFLFFCGIIQKNP